MTKGLVVIYYCLIRYLVVTKKITRKYKDLTIVIDMADDKFWEWVISKER
jgi:hypothetical protein